MVQKAVEMGVGALKPVFTERTQASRVNRERMRANAVEAAEQCGILTIPEVHPDEDFRLALHGFEPDRVLVFCDEEAPVATRSKR
jgi:16S rRNA (uracil1498-N3)-methyltransferase